MKKILANVVGYAALTIILTAGAAQSLSGSNTVFSDDIADGQVTGADIKDGTITTPDLKNGALSGSKILDNSVTGADINESTLSIHRTLFARVNANGTLNQSGDASAAARSATGSYTVTFPGDLGACAIGGTSAFFPNADTFNSAAHVWVNYNPGAVSGSTTVLVQTSNGATAIDASFVLQVICP